MNDQDTEPKEFQIKLRYKVGNNTHYLKYEKFTYHNIRNQNLYQNELETFKKNTGQNIMTPGFFTNFKNILDTKDKTTEKFLIPFSRNYITSSNIQNYIKDPSINTLDPLESNDFDNNKQKFFLTSNTKNIKHYFEYLNKNLEKNKNPQTRIYPQDKNQPPPPKPDNTETERKKMVIEYAKYILSDEEYGNDNDKDKLFKKIESNQIQLREIITYRNIFKLLQLFYLQEGTILVDQIFQKKYDNDDNDDNTNQPSLSKEEIYLKIKKINCIKLNDNELYDAFQNNNGIIKPIYEIEFEVIPTFSTIAFNINLIDTLNPNNILKNTIDNFRADVVKNATKGAPNKLAAAAAAMKALKDPVNFKSIKDMN